MSESLAQLLVRVFAGYAAVGVLVALPFAFRGVNRLDADAAEGSLGFRLLILPGAAALWPLVLLRWRSGQPALERSPHRLAARADGAQARADVVQEGRA